jgi:hypothetical protein
MSDATNIASRGATMAVDWEQRIDFPRLRAHREASGGNGSPAAAARETPERAGV